MAQFEFQSTIEEWWPLIEVALNQSNFRYVINRPYSEPYAPTFTAFTTELKQEILNTLRSIFITSDSFSISPPYFRKQQTGIMAGAYFVDISRGGPLISCSLPAEFEEGGITWVAESTLSFQQRYWSDDLTRVYPAPQNLKTAFVNIRQILQDHLYQKKIEKHNIWVSSHAWKLFQTGLSAFRLSGKCYTIDGQVQAPPVWLRPPIVASPNL